MNEDSVPQLPSGWVWTKLGEVVERISNGITQKQTKKGEGTPVTRIETISDGVINLRKVGYLRDLPHAVTEKYRLWLGDILFSHINSDMHLGKTAIFDIENYALLHGMNLLLIRPNKNILVPDFLNYLFNHYRSKGLFVSIAQHAVNQSSINQTKMVELLIPLAPFKEQVRIVAKLEELFVRLDAGVEELRKVKAQLKRYRQAVLKYAFEGKLTEEWRNTHKDQMEPAQALLQKINEERIKRGTGQWKNTGPIDVKGLPEIPDGWMWVRAQEVCENITNGYTPPASELHHLKGEIPFIKVNNLTFTGKLEFSKNMAFIDKKLHETMLKRSKVFPGDVLVNIVGPPLGKVSIVPNLYPEWNINQAIVFFRPIEGYNRDFLALGLQTNAITSHLTDQAKATAGQFNISVNMSRDLPIPLPPREEQDKIVSEVKKRFDAVERVETTTNESMSKADYLRNSVLKAAFTGHLVPQDPSDEPAKELLERIREERAKFQGEKNMNKKKTKPKQLELCSYVK